MRLPLRSLVVLSFGLALASFAGAQSTRPPAVSGAARRALGRGRRAGP